MNDTINNRSKYKQGWTGGLPETECGFGSKLEQTKAQRDWLPKIVKDYGITSIADIGAGDLNWMRHVNLGCDYQGYDLVPRHPDVKPFDLLADPMPVADCYLCVWVLNHFPADAALLALQRLQTGGKASIALPAKYLIMQYETRMPSFLDLPYLDSVTIRARSDERGNVDLRLHEL